MKINLFHFNFILLEIFDQCLKICKQIYLLFNHGKLIAVFINFNGDLAERKEIFVYDIIAFIGEVGGSLGLLLGFSFLLILDLCKPVIKKLSMNEFEALHMDITCGSAWNIVKCTLAIALLTFFLIYFFVPSLTKYMSKGIRIFVNLIHAELRCTHC